MSTLARNLLTVGNFARNLYTNRKMIWAMALRDLKVRYIGSFFGLFWAVIQPLCLIAIYGTVFGLFFKARPSPASGTDNFLLYFICGFLPWLFFSQTVNMSTKSLLSNANLIRKSIGFPSEFLPIVTVIMNGINHLLAISVACLVILILEGKLTAYSPLILVYLLLIAVFAVGIGWILSSINIYLRDIEQVTGLILLGWFFFTPIFYSPDIIPPKLRSFLTLNPLYHVVDAYRHILLAGKMPPLSGFVVLAILALFIFALGGFIFKKLKPGFAEVL